MSKPQVALIHPTQDREQLDALTIDEVLQDYQEELAIEEACRKAKADRLNKVYRERCAIVEAYVLEALHQETHVSLADLSQCSAGVEYSEHSNIVEISGEKWPRSVDAQFAFYHIPIEVRYQLKHDDDQICYERRGSFYCPDQARKSFPSFAETLAFCKSQADKNARYAQHLEERAAREEREYQERLAREQAEKDHLADLLNRIAANKVALDLVRVFLRVTEQHEVMEDALYNAQESWDRCAESSANTIGDLQREVEHTKSALHREQQRATDLEYELDEERRKRIEAERGRGW